MMVYGEGEAGQGRIYREGAVQGRVREDVDIKCDDVIRCHVYTTLSHVMMT